MARHCMLVGVFKIGFSMLGRYWPAEKKTVNRHFEEDFKKDENFHDVLLRLCKYTTFIWASQFECMRSTNAQVNLQSLLLTLGNK